MEVTHGESYGKMEMTEILERKEREEEGDAETNTTKTHTPLELTSA
jgi:hypothetical protein